MDDNENAMADIKIERRKFRDRCAIAAMQSLIQVYASLDENGYGALAYNDPANFQSMAGRAVENGWRDPPGGSVADHIAMESFSIARAMQIERDDQDNLDDEDFEEETEEDGDAEATEETACSTNASRQHDDRSAVLGVSPIKPPADVSQVGSS